MVKAAERRREALEIHFTIQNNLVLIVALDKDGPFLCRMAPLHSTESRALSNKAANVYEFTTGTKIERDRINTVCMKPDEFWKEYSAMINSLKSV